MPLHSLGVLGRRGSVHRGGWPEAGMDEPASGWHAAMYRKTPVRPYASTSSATRVALKISAPAAAGVGRFWKNRFFTSE